MFSPPQFRAFHRVLRTAAAACIAFFAAISADAGTTINAVNSFAYAANVGWLNAYADGTNGAVIGQTVCSGYIYSANGGWISLGSGAPANGVSYQNIAAGDFGVNLDTQGNLRGFAYSANLGWINFENTGAPQVNLTSGVFSGYAWSANAGWISLSNSAAFVQSSTNLFGPGERSVEAPQGIVAWWPANSNAVDVIGGNDGALNNGVSYVPGEASSAFNFDSDSAMVVLANNPALQLQNFSVEMWVQRGSLAKVTLDGQAVAGNALIFGYGHLGYTAAMGPNGNLILSCVDQDDVVSTAAIADLNWHHIAVTTTNGAVVFYLDGAAYPAGNYLRAYQFTTLPAIGGRADNINKGNNDSFLGSVDELAVYNRALSASEILSIYEAGSAGKSLPAPTPLPAPSGMVAWWPANSNAVDVVGGYNGILTNGVGYAPGEAGAAFNFTNNHSGVFIGNPVALQLQNLTIEAWVKRANASSVSGDPTANGGAAALFYYGSQGYGMGMHADGAISLTKIDVDDVNDDAYGARVTDTNWHHVAVTKSNTVVSFYIDGEAYPSVNYGSTFQFSSSAAIGVRGDLVNNNNNDSFAGAIDELAIYNRALTPAEISSIYQAGAAGKAVSAVSDYVVVTGNQLGTFNWQTGLYTPLGTPNGGSGKIEDMAHLPGGPLYATDSSANLLTINPSNLQVSVIGPLGNSIIGLAMRSDGVLFGFNRTSFYTINSNTAAATLVGNMEVATSTYYDGKFDASGNFYLVENDQLYTVNTATGSASLIGPIGFSMYGLGFENGVLYGFTSDGKILTINPATGSGTLLVNQNQANPIFAASSGGLFVGSPVAPPALNIIPSGAGVAIAWPATGNFTLQQTTNVGNPSSWTTSSNAVTTSNGTNRAAINLSGGGYLFFRLIGH